ncbi:hypothetical protein DL98DRAFT_538174 [Cadophora sp. DSE1049]|nr:hypothetical protein DL98DRAFT_538174 [Cadophora sp. DSE1049]
MAPKSTPASVTEIKFRDELEMSFEFGPPRQLPDASPASISDQTAEHVFRPTKIKLTGPPSCWIGPPSLGAGLSRALCTAHSENASTPAITPQTTRSPSKVNKSNGSKKTSAVLGRRTASATGRGKKRRRGSETAELKPLKAPKVARTEKDAKRAAKRATKKAVKKLSELSIEFEGTDYLLRFFDKFGMGRTQYEELGLRSVLRVSRSRG